MEITAKISLINGLRDVRRDLQNANAAAEDLHYKLVGPRPSDISKAPQATNESVLSILTDIQCLASALNKHLTNNHDVLGNHAPSVEPQQQLGQSAQRAGQY